MGLEKWTGALRERNFRLYFLGQLTSSIGTGMTPVALSFAVLALRPCVCVRRRRGIGSPNGSARGLPARRGVAGDRFGRRHVMLGADVLRASAETALGAWILFGHPPFWGFLLLPALVGTARRSSCRRSPGSFPDRPRRSPDSGQRTQRADVLDRCDHRAIGRRRHRRDGQPGLGDPRRCSLVCLERVLARSPPPRAGHRDIVGLLLRTASTRVARILVAKPGFGRSSWWRRSPTWP